MKSNINSVKEGRVGTLCSEVLNTLGLTGEEAPIYLGESNISHMTNKHPDDFNRYGKYIKSILKAPDYVGINPKDNSIEYVKEFCINNEYVKVAVRVSGNGIYYARSLYVLNSERVKNFITKGSLKPLDKSS